MTKTSWTRLLWSSDREPEPTPAAKAVDRRETAAAPVPATDDPKLNQMLVAFESMKAAMPAAQLAIALRATAKALDVDPIILAKALQKRVLALDAAVADAHRSASEREATRGAELATATTKVRAEIEQMEQAIATRREQLAAVTDQIHRMTAEDRASAATFEAKARDEAARLIALRDVLGPIPK